MEYVDLVDLIDCLTYKTKLNICIDFLDDHGNYKTALPFSNSIHGKPYCEHMKSTEKGFEKCFKCRTLALKKATERKQPFGGFCFNGLYEYCHPVVEKDCVIAVIMVGNIYRSGGRTELQELACFQGTFEEDFPEENCRKICTILDGHIKLLIREYSDRQSEYNPLIRNIRNYIEEFLYNDISVSQIALAFNYSEKYIGKLFKTQTGMSIREYLNSKRLGKAAMLLENTNQSITEISSKSGFNNVTYFNRMFKKQYFMTPSEFRENRKSSS